MSRSRVFLTYGEPQRGESRAASVVQTTAGQRAQALLDKWDLTEAWLQHTARILGNILGAPEPDSPQHYVETTMKAAFLDPLANYMNRSTTLLDWMEREARGV